MPWSGPTGSTTRPVAAPRLTAATARIAVRRARRYCEEVTDAPLHVLTENIFGVDLDAQAVEVAKLSLWLRYMALNRESFRDRLRSRSRRGKPLNLLPTLTRNLKRGNSLIDDPAVAGDAAFVWPKEFPEVMQAGGFDVVIGNPPYERIQTMQAHAPEAVEFLKATTAPQSPAISTSTSASSNAACKYCVRTATSATSARTSSSSWSTGRVFVISSAREDTSAKLYHLGINRYSPREHIHVPAFPRQPTAGGLPIRQG